jgi:catechol 2,3-dioxygenase-like lactoylglutathione lyase family enzyme
MLNVLADTVEFSSLKHIEAIVMKVRLSISQIDHCSVIITDVERSRRFYRDLLGLKEIHKPRTFDFVVLWFDLGNMHIHLLLKEKADTISPRHFALRVADAAKAREYFRQENVPIHETTPIPGADRFFIHDPDGNRIEIIHWQRPYSSEENAPG